MKKRGFGSGKYNGVGGKANEGETIKEVAIREMEEEIIVKAHQEDLEEVAHLKFYFKDNPNWNQKCYVYFLYKWKGEPVETQEMSPEWFSVNDIPYKKMWIDDILWLPRVLSGEKIQATFHFTNNGDVIDKANIIKKQNLD